MLGPIGPLVSSFLRSRGYQISRPTQIENKFSRGFWKDWFATDPSLFASVYHTNRKTLASVSKWIDESTLANSLWRYGVPIEWCAALDEIESEITASDVLGFAARRLGHGVSYLEIGVSVGKNLLQIERQLSGASVVGLDVETLNPMLERQFSSCETVEKLGGPLYEVETLSGRRVKKQAALHRLKSDRNTFDYLSADQFRDDTWAALKGRRFNLIFSDGVHSADALRSEFQFLLKHELIDKTRCVMFWDDLHGIDMQSAFLDNARSLAKMFGKGDQSIWLFRLHGSYGYQRPMGMFSSI